MSGSLKYSCQNILETLELICSPIFSSSEKKCFSNQEKRPPPPLAATGRPGGPPGASGIIPRHYICISTPFAASASKTYAAEASVADMFSLLDLVLVWVVASLCYSIFSGYTALLMILYNAFYLDLCSKWTCILQIFVRRQLSSVLSPRSVRNHKPLVRGLRSPLIR